jgi:membrane fusion protein
MQALERQRVALLGSVARNAERERELAAEHQAGLAALELSRVDVDDRALDNDRATAQTLTAPMDGVIVSLATHPGAEVTAGKELMVIAPSDARLLAQAFVPVDAIGFIAKGDRVAIQYDSFPHRSHGEYGGTVVEIAEFVFDRRDLEVEIALQQPVFRILVALDAISVEVNGTSIPLKPGMTFAAHVATRTLTVAEWLFEPLLRLRDAPFDVAFGA